MKFVSRQAYADTLLHKVRITTNVVSVTSAVIGFTRLESSPSRKHHNLTTSDR